MARPKGPPDLKALADLGLSMAEQTMRTKGRLKPSQIYAVDGEANLYVIDFEIEQSAILKDISALKLRAFFKEKKVERYVFVTEVWYRVVRTRTPEERLAAANSVPPSQAPDRMEAIIAVGQDRQGTVELCRPILRTEGGKYRGLGEPETMGDVSVGRFANMLPRDALQ